MSIITILLALALAPLAWAIAPWVIYTVLN
jgi:hypothetical protein